MQGRTSPHSRRPSILFAAALVVASVLACLPSLPALSAENAADQPDLLAAAVRSVALVEKGKEPEWRDSVAAEKPVDVAFRAVFQVEDPTAPAALAIEKPPYMSDFTLNGTRLALPVQGMLYARMPGVPPSLLRKGENELAARWNTRTAGAAAGPHTLTAADLPVRLLSVPASALAIQSGPVLGCAGTDFFTAALRTNMPAEVVLETDGRTFVSAPGLMHAFRVDGLRPATAYEYKVTARLTGEHKAVATAGPYTVRTLPEAGPLVFAVMGDNRSNPEAWARVSAAAAAHKPAFTVLTGDVVGNGRRDEQWDEQCFAPAKDLFATIPTFAVIGNHEQDSLLFLRMFINPSGEKNWAQQIGPVQLIGIDGLMNWEPGGKLAEWLDQALASSRAGFVFLASHYPAWTAGKHGRLAEDGLPREKTIRAAQQVIMPMLESRKATVMIAGHVHTYERSEPPRGVSQITSGGAGAPLSEKEQNSEKQNPFCKVYAMKLHYCIFTVDGDTCTMKAYTPEGEMLDECTWTARKP